VVALAVVEPFAEVDRFHFARATVVPFVSARAEVAGADTRRAPGLTCGVAVEVDVLKRTAVAAFPPSTPATGTLRGVAVIEVTSSVERVVAVAGATEVNTPIPKAATATSAVRLKVVFVDICFLSISRVREFPAPGFG
jgi:hypothetical protein